MTVISAPVLSERYPATDEVHPNAANPPRRHPQLVRPPDLNRTTRRNQQKNQTSTNLFDSYRHEALLLSGLGCLIIFGLLFASLRSLSRTLRVVAPLACAVLCVTAILLLNGIQLTILHLVGLLLVVAVGSNYALFFDRGAQTGSEADRRQTQISLVVANLTTVGSFGLLGLSKVPVLSALGSTVGLGAFLALIFAAILTRERSDAHSH